MVLFSSDNIDLLIKIKILLTVKRIFMDFTFVKFVKQNDIFTVTANDDCLHACYKWGEGEEAIFTDISH